ncbi:MAG: hypothetical protein M3138_08975 [Actinomycetota bacterium]|nr:hypothetical protein [Actinomycetota bacterium]
MSDFTERESMIEEIAYPADMMPTNEQDLLEDPSTFFRGALVAIAVSLPVWSGLIWGAAKLA